MGEIGRIERVSYNAGINGGQIKDDDLDYILDIGNHSEENGDKFVVFTASKVLLEQLEKYKAQMPFEATIEQRKSGKHFYFTLT